MSELRKRLANMNKESAELLNETEAKETFLKNMDEIIKGLDDAADDCSRALMEMRNLEEEHYLEGQQNVFDHIDELMDKLETESQKIKNMKEKINFNINH